MVNVPSSSLSQSDLVLRVYEINRSTSPVSNCKQLTHKWCDSVILNFLRTAAAKMSALTVGNLHAVVCIMKGRKVEGKLQQICSLFSLSLNNLILSSQVYTLALWLAMYFYIYSLFLMLGPGE